MGCSGSKKVEGGMDWSIGVFGLSNAGKTCLLRFLAGETNFSTTPTNSIVTGTAQYETSALTLYEFGSRSIAFKWPDFYPRAISAIFVVDAVDCDHFVDAAALLNQVMRHPMMTEKPHVVLANERPGQVSVTPDAIARYFPPNTQIFSTSLQIRDGLFDAISYLYKAVSRNWESVQSRMEREIQQRQAEGPASNIIEMQSEDSGDSHFPTDDENL
jgi:GTPase SAR1 family protein